MLERATRCLESRAPRHKHLSRSVLQSRRQLHSAFWHHGAADLPEYLNSIATLFEHTQHSARDSPRPWQLHDTHDSPCFLDFLYPSETLALLRTWTRRRGSRSFPRRAETFLHAPRSYTSFARSTLANPDTIVAEKPAVRTRQGLHKEIERQEKTQQEPAAHQPMSAEELDQSRILRSMLDRASSIPPEDLSQGVWVQYNTLPSKALRDRLRADVFKILALSTRPMDRPRASQLFSEISVHYYTEELLSIAVNVFLKKGDLEKAAAAHDNLMSLTALQEPHFDRSKGLLVRLYQHQSWSQLFTSYRARREAREINDFSKEAHTAWRHELVSALRALPRFALSISTMLEHFVATGGIGQDDNAKSFIRTLVFPLINEPYLPRFQAGAMELLEQLRQASYVMVEAAAKNIVERDGPLDTAMRCYDVLRRAGHKPRRLLIGRLLDAAIESDDAPTIYKLVRDSEQFYGKLYVHTAIQLMTWHSRRADVQACEDVIQQHRVHARALKHGFFHPILHAEALRFGPAAVEQRFVWIERNFTLRPDLRFWNILLNAYARFDDIDGAQLAFGQMRDVNVKPDVYTIGTLLGICAARGDVRLARSFLRLAAEENIQITAPMNESLVLAYINDGRLKVAIDLATQTAQDAPHAATRMWTQVLAALASQRQFARGIEASQRMRELQVPFDGAAYAALMRIFTSNREPHKALRVMSDLMRKDRISYSAIHYAILMNGYVDANKLESAYRAYAQWLSDKDKLQLEESISIRMVLLKLQASAARRQLQTYVIPGPRFELIEELLQELLDAPNSLILADKQPQLLLKDRTLSEAEPAAYFDVLFQIYDQTQAVETTKLLLQMVKDCMISTRPLERWRWPVRVIYYIMKARQEIGDHVSVMRLWDMALETVQQRYQASTKPPEVEALSSGESKKPAPQHLPARARHVLARHVDIYLRSMSDSQSMLTVSDTLRNYEKLGFQLDNSNWNLYVRMLLARGLILQAFVLAERKLMPGFRKYQIRYLWQLRKGSDPKQTPLGHDRRQIARGANFIVYSTVEFLAKVWTELRLDLSVDDADHDSASSRVVAQEGTPNASGEVVQQTIEEAASSFDSWQAISGKLKDAPRHERLQLLRLIMSNAPETVAAISDFPYPDLLLPGEADDSLDDDDLLDSAAVVDQDEVDDGDNEELDDAETRKQP